MQTKQKEFHQMTSATSIKVGHAAECSQLVQERTKGVFVSQSGSDASICVPFPGHSMSYSFIFYKNNRNAKVSPPKKSLWIDNWPLSLTGCRLHKTIGGQLSQCFISITSGSPASLNKFIAVKILLSWPQWGAEWPETAFFRALCTTAGVAGRELMQNMNIMLSQCRVVEEGLVSWYLPLLRTN